MNHENAPVNHTAMLQQVNNGIHPVRFRRTILICAALVAIMGCIGLTGWMLGQPALSSFGSGKIPMAPSTALLLVLSALALCLPLHPAGRQARWPGFLVNLAVSGTALLLFILSSLGIHPDAEHLGFSIPPYSGTTPLGHMSPVTALCFMWASLSFLASHASSAIRTGRLFLAGLCAFLLMLANYLFVLAYLYGDPLFYGGVFIPPALPTCLSFLLLGGALLARLAQHEQIYRYLTVSDARTTSVFILMFVILAAGIVIAGFLYSRSFEKTYRTGRENQLSSIGDLKVGELQQWRKDRLEHGAVLSRLEILSLLVKRVNGARNDAEARRLLVGWLGTYPDSLHYDEVRLLDVAGATRIALPDTGTPTCSEVQRRVTETVRSGRATLVDFYRNDHDKKVYLAMLVPIMDAQDEKRVIGIVALRINPETYLYPLIKLWPVPTRTAETLLIRRDGSDVLYLNQLRFRADAALNQRISLAATDVPAVKAILGQKGIVEGRDYRGTAVIAYLRAIPDSSWYLVAKTDRAEVYEPLRERLRLIGIFVAVVLAGAGLGIGLTWRQQRLNYYRDKLLSVEALRESDERFRLAVEESPFPIMIHAEDGTVLSLSRAWTEISGYGLSDIPTIGEWTYKAYGIKHIMMDEEIRTLYTLERRVSEGEFIVTCKDGSQRVWDFSSMSIGRLPDGRRMAISMAADVTDRKDKEQELARKNAELERYSYTVSHDLKSPLITIRSFSGAIRRDLETGRQDRIAKDLGRIEAASAKMAELLDDLLELSRVGHLSHAPEPVPLAGLVDDALANLSGPIREHNVTVAVQADLPTVDCDRQRMAEVIQNLLENAIKYRGDQAAPHIRVGMRHEDAAAVYFVQDNGMGIDPRYHENVFGLFNKLDARSDGSGIGLALVKRIIEVHGGRVWVESEGVGRGATFCFTLNADKFSNMKGG